MAALVETPPVEDNYLIARTRYLEVYSHTSRSTPAQPNRGGDVAGANDGDLGNQRRADGRNHQSS